MQENVMDGKVRAGGCATADVAAVSSYSKRGVKGGALLLEDGSRFEGVSFGYERAAAGEVVFSTGMVGYPETLTDPSYTGQLLTLTYPLVGNYGVPERSLWEGDRLSVAGLVASTYIDTPVHAQSTMSLASWLQEGKVPALEIKDTRLLTRHIRAHGTMLGKIVFDVEPPFYDPDGENLVARVSTARTRQEGSGDVTIALIDCGAKRNMTRALLQRNVRVITVPWDWDLFAPGDAFAFDGVVISNGPGNPKMVARTIQTIRTALERRVPMLGICLGHQLLALAAGGDTYKLKYGHRSQNQPCLLHGSQRCFITTQNHSFAVGQLPAEFSPWFINANDGSNEGMRHDRHPFLSVQFHPEAAPGPVDTDWIFDTFLERVREGSR
jgi:carbamoyl-phosphate synthase small subunit